MKLLPALLLLAGAAANRQAAPPHHEHPSQAQEPHAGDAHHHGDADDHHESPDSPCHHHDASMPGCGCGPLTVAVPEIEPFSSTLTARRLHSAERRPALPALLDELAHVPLA